MVKLEGIGEILTKIDNARMKQEAERLDKLIREILKGETK
jgi:hypothetical protein